MRAEREGGGGGEPGPAGYRLFGLGLNHVRIPEVERVNGFHAAWR